MFNVTISSYFWPKVAHLVWTLDMVLQLKFMRDEKFYLCEILPCDRKLQTTLVFHIYIGDNSFSSDKRQDWGKTMSSSWYRRGPCLSIRVVFGPCCRPTISIHEWQGRKCCLSCWVFLRIQAGDLFFLSQPSDDYKKLNKTNIL